MNFLLHVKDRLSDKVPKGSKRSGEWPRIRKEHLAKFPTCSVCGGNKKLEVHHIKPYHLYPSLELDPDNLITLCEGNSSINCHLEIGHLQNFKSYNEHVERDAKYCAERIKNRP